MIAFDVEATGIDLVHGCLPYFFAFAHDNGKLEWAEWSVDPLTRLPLVDTSDLDSIIDLLGSDEIVCHHANFDLQATRALLDHAIDYYGYGWDLDWNWSDIHDTLIMSHAWRNLWGHSLKSLRNILFQVDDSKQDALRQAVNQARRICRKKDFIKAHGEWRIAGPSDPHWPAIDKSPGEKQKDIEGWWYLDTWLPKAIYDRAPEFLPDPSTCLPTYDDVFSQCDADPDSYNYDYRYTDERKGDSMDHPWRTVLRNYALEDVETTIPLYHFLDHALQTEGLYDNYLERLQLLRVTYEMKERGVTLKPSLQKNMERYTSKADKEGNRAVRIAKRVLQVDEFNIGSSKQLQHLLYSEDGFELPIIKRTKPSKTAPLGQASTDAETIDKLYDLVLDDPRYQNPHAKSFFESLLISRKNRTASNYLRNYHLWSRDGRLHSNLNITGTKFTRQSSNDPNLQNAGTGKEDEDGELDFNLREDFGPGPGYVWLAWDYSNIELRLWAYQTGNRELIAAFENNRSVHLIIARELHKELVGMSDEEATETRVYKKTKNGNFSILYGAAPYKANATYGVRDAYNRINKRFPEVRDFTQTLHGEVRDRGYIETLGGYRLYIPTDQPHVAVSGKIQGTAGQTIGRAMIECTTWCRFNAPCCRLILQIHDELVFEVPKGFFLQNRDFLVDNLSGIMERQGDEIGVPVPVKGNLIENTWADGVPL